MDKVPNGQVTVDQRRSNLGRSPDARPVIQPREAPTGLPVEETQGSHEVGGKPRLEATAVHTRTTGPDVRPSLLMRRARRADLGL